MAISRAKKEEIVARYVDILGQSDGIFIAKFTAMGVAETEQLRHKLFEADGEFMVVKNTLLKIALERSGWPVPEDLLTGQSGVAFSKGSMSGTAKILIDFIKAFDKKFAIKGGVMGASTFAEKDLEAISNMPTLPEIQAQILGILVQPASQLVGIVQAADAQIVNVLQPGVSGILNVLHAHIEQNLKGGEGDSTAAA